MLLRDDSTLTSWRTLVHVCDSLTSACLSNQHYCYLAFVFGPYYKIFSFVKFCFGFNRSFFFFGFIVCFSFSFCGYSKTNAVFSIRSIRALRKLMPTSLLKTCQTKKKKVKKKNWTQVYDFPQSKIIDSYFYSMSVFTLSSLLS